MASDYPDYTELMQIIGSDIMVPMDIQAAYIMMPVDIQAQYITLDIDIVAQTIGNIAIDIAAQSVGNIAINLAASAITLDINIKTSAITLNVDITAQTISELKIDIDAQHVGIFLQPDWQAEAGTDKNLEGHATIAAGGAEVVLDYTVTANKTFYICQFGFGIDESSALFCEVQEYYDATAYTRFISGGYPGNSLSLSKPVLIPAGHHLYARLHNVGATGGEGYVTIGGYEI